MNKLLENDHIRLRAPEPEDLDLLYHWENDTRLWENGATVVPFSRYSLKQYLIENKHDIFVDRQLRLMVTLRKTKETIGAVDLYDFEPLHRRAGVGILIDPEHQRQGHGSQALSLLEDYAFRFLQLKQLFAIISVKNQFSQRLFLKAGYHLTGRMEKWICSDNSFDDAVFLQKIHLG